jgi:hypothetical protein
MNGEYGLSPGNQREMSGERKMFGAENWVVVRLVVLEIKGSR